MLHNFQERERDILVELRKSDADRIVDWLASLVVFGLLVGIVAIALGMFWRLIQAAM